MVPVYPINCAAASPADNNVTLYLCRSPVGNSVTGSEATVIGTKESAWTHPWLNF